MVAAELELLTGAELAGTELASLDEFAGDVMEDATADELAGETLVEREDTGTLELIAMLEDFEPPPLPPQAVRPNVRRERSNTRE